MKMKQTLALVVLVLFASVNWAQTEPTKTKADARNIVKLNFDGLFEGRYQFAYERLVGDFISVQGSVGVIFDYEFSESSTSIDVTDYSKNGFVFTPEMRVYLSEFTNDNPPKGFYVGAFARYRTFAENDLRRTEFEYRKNTNDVTTVGAGLHFGIQYYTSFGVGFDAWLGPEFRYRTQNSTEEYDYSPTGGGAGSGSRKEKVNETVVFAGVGIVYAF
jgi:hypothetical protein